MQQVVSITSQGQISIPAKIRRQMGLSKHRKVSVRTEGKKVVVEPIPDILSLAGSLQHKALKGKSIQQVIKLEEGAAQQGAVERYSSVKAT